MKNVNENFSISYNTKGRLPSLPFVDIKNRILGTSYVLSVACVSKQQAQKLNMMYRQKDYVPNILSFSLTKNSGELILHLPTIKKQFESFEMSYHGYILYLYIHGCLHLKGYDHGEKMDRLESKYIGMYKKYI
jgi:rRNA maturation RNase YbeY